MFYENDYIRKIFKKLVKTKCANNSLNLRVIEYLNTRIIIEYLIYQNYLQASYDFNLN